jgi:hypothetical protein
LPSLLAPFFESLPLQTNKQQEEFSLLKRPVLFVALFLFAKLKARRSNLPCLSEALDLMQSTVSLPLKLIELRAVAPAPADDDRLNPHPPQWCSFSFCLSVVVDDLLVQRTGLQRWKRRCFSTARHLILGIGLSWACTCTRPPRASYTGCGASETGPHVCRCVDGHRSSQKT